MVTSKTDESFAISTFLGSGKVMVMFLGENYKTKLFLHHI